MTTTAHRRHRLGATTRSAGRPEPGTACWPASPASRTLTHDWVEQYELPVHLRRADRRRPAEVLAAAEIKRLDPSGQFALIAAREAWADAGTPEVDPERLGVVIASGIGGVCDPARRVRHAAREGRPPRAPA